MAARKKARKVALRGKFHGLSVNVLATEGTYYGERVGLISWRAAQRARRKLCPSPGCCCGDSALVVLDGDAGCGVGVIDLKEVR